MRKLKLYMATSLDGKIAGSKDDVKWLEEIPNPEKTDYGYYDFYRSVDTTIMGNTTYKMIENFEGKFPYPDTKNYVASSKKQADNQDVCFTTDPIALVKELKDQEGKDIWLIGGASLNSSIWNASLIDEIHLYIMPIILGDGVTVFHEPINRGELQLINTSTFNSGVVAMIYKVKK